MLAEHNRSIKRLSLVSPELLFSSFEGRKAMTAFARAHNPKLTRRHRRLTCEAIVRSGWAIRERRLIKNFAGAHRDVTRKDERTRAPQFATFI